MVPEVLTQQCFKIFLWFHITWLVIDQWKMRYQSIFLCIILKLIIIQAGIMINCRNAGLNYHKFQSIIYVSNSGQSYENHPILNVYNFLYRIYFENLTGNLIELISKNKVTSLFFLNFIFLRSWKIFKCYIYIVEYRLPVL